MKRERPIEQRIRSMMTRIWEQLLSGKGWTFVCLLWVGLLTVAFLFMTVYLRPLEQVLPKSQRVQHIMHVWFEHGFWKHAGLGFSESPEANPNAMVYKSRAPAFLYPLYLVNVINSWRQGETFSLQVYILYSQLILCLSAACFGFLGVRLARRLGTSSLLALLCGMVGQFIFHTFPFNLEKYFEPMAVQISCLALIIFLLIEEWSFEISRKYVYGLQGICVFIMIYCNKDIAIPGLSMYGLAHFLFKRKWHAKKMLVVLSSVLLGLVVPALQLWFVKLNFPEISLVGATFIWRSGLDGATNYAGILTPEMFGNADSFLRNIGVFALIMVLWHFFRGAQSTLHLPFILLFTAIGFYMMPGYLFSQSFQIHPYVYELFLPIASILAWCYILVPYWENRTGNSGVITLLLILIGFCLCMYQLRVFAVRYPLSIPEPDWRSYLLFG